MPDLILSNWLRSERVRYLSAFSAIWSGFNDWYHRDTRFKGNDRQILDSIQALTTTDPLGAAFETVCEYDDQRVQRSMRMVQDPATRGAVAFLAQTRFSSLVRGVMLNPTLASLVWTSGQPPHSRQN